MKTKILTVITNLKANKNKKYTFDLYTFDLTFENKKYTCKNSFIFDFQFFFCNHRNKKKLHFIFFHLKLKKNFITLYMNCESNSNPFVHSC